MINVSIVVHNTDYRQLQQALSCLSNKDIDTIYIIDNGPDDLLRKISSSFDKIKYRHVKNNGFGAGHNIALAETIKRGTEYHLVMNADVKWEGDILTPLIEYLKQHPNTGLIAPKTFYPNGEIQYTCRMLPTPWDLFLKRFLPSGFKKRRMNRYLLQDYDHQSPINCPYLLGSFMLFRTEALKDTGLFDERFFMYPEDIDITRRIHEKWETIYWPGVSIIHEHQRASYKNFKMFWIHFSNMVKYFNKWGWIKDKGRKKINRELQKAIRNI